MPLDSQLIAGALAHGLSPGVIATWDPRLARTPRVMVPVQLDVLMVRDEGGSWAQTAMTVPDPGTTPLAHTLLPDPFTERAPRPKGGYLHWALPDALTSGSGTAHGGDVSFPPIPDRWLVVRLSTPEPGARRAVTAWVLESGGQQPVVTPLDSWTEPEDPERTTVPGEQPLSALGHGDAAWSAYFDNVEDRLAFYDDLSDGQGGTVVGRSPTWSAAGTAGTSTTRSAKGSPRRPSSRPGWPNWAGRSTRPISSRRSPTRTPG